MSKQNGSGQAGQAPAQKPGQERIVLPSPPPPPPRKQQQYPQRPPARTPPSQRFPHRQPQRSPPPKRRPVLLVETAPERPYNPFDHRDVKKPTSDSGALAHMLKTSLGSGILAMPMAFKNSGLVFGSLGTVTIGIIATYCIYMLIKCSQILCVRHKVPTLTFPKTAERAFEKGPPSAKKNAKLMGILVTAQLLSSFILGNSVYVVFMSQTLYQVVKFFGNVQINTRYFSLMLWIPLILMCLIRDLKSLVPFSVIANLCVIVSFSIVMYYIFRDIHPPSSVHFIAPISRWPSFLTTVIFAIEGIGTVMSIENEMKNPQHFIGGRCPIVFIAMTVVVVVYVFVGFFGYLQYGEATMGSVTLNLPILDKLAQTVKILIALAIFFTYALQFYVPINLVRDMIQKRVKPKYHLLTDIMVRIGLVSLTVINALVLPNLEPIITLVGAVCFTALGLLIPPLIDTMTRYPEFGKYKWHLVKNACLVTLSLISLVAGTYKSILDIIKDYS